MSKYITHFQTESAYQAALPSMELPNVSLVDELGEVHYHRALYGAHTGDIALYDVAEAQKIVVTANDWNLTSYPTSSYPIIGVVVTDESVTGVTLVSTHSFNADGTAASEDTESKWQNDIFSWNLTSTYSTGDAAKTDFNGKANTAAIIEAIKAYDLAHSTDNITGNIGQGIQLYAPTGTNAGDWYIPADGELNILNTNLSTVRGTLEKIYTADNSLAVNIRNGATYMSSSEHSTGQSNWFFNLGYGTTASYSKNSRSRFRPFYQLA